ncbi:MAG: hypothetical protein BroJett024_08880 [Alphaproteobacteria bacterium]|nr:MAG: hypothetical protein BroJett024_08880 [Alphaproteobacteria bacterium]
MSKEITMADRSVVISGLPASGKTTYLAALWHLVTAREAKALRFESLRHGDATHLNAIAARWRSARVQDRTPVGSDRLVSMNLVDETGRSVRVTFPDVSGEAFRRMWEDRECEPAIADIIRSGNVLLFVHADTIQAPQWVADVAALSRQLGLPLPEGGEVPWNPRLAPTQVQLVGLLQLLCSPPLDIGPRKLGVVLSAWDKAEGEQLTPEDFIEAKLPLLHQYLRWSGARWLWRAYGVSAQGGDYDSADEKAASLPQANALRALDRPAMRIKLISEGRESNDLTEPLAWLVE